MKQYEAVGTRKALFYSALLHDWKLSEQTMNFLNDQAAEIKKTVSELPESWKRSFLKNEINQELNDDALHIVHTDKVRKADNEFRKCPVSIYLGEIEIAYEDLVKLQCGMQVEFNPPKEYRAAIVVSGVKWADVQIGISPEKIQLTLKN